MQVASWRDQRGERRGLRIIEEMPTPSSARSLVYLAALCLVLLALPAHPTPVPDLYSARVPGSAAELNAVFARGLGQVFAKVSGQSAAATPGMLANAGALVTQYQPQPGGTFRVRFNPGEVRRRLDAAGWPVWTGDRPLLLVSAPGATDPALRQLLLDTAAARGIPAEVLEPAASPMMTEELLVTQAKSRSAGALLLGRQQPVSGAAAWRWSLVVMADPDAPRFEWQGDALAGMDGAADRLATRFAPTVAQHQTFTVLVQGITEVAGFGRLQKTLAALDLVESAVLRRVVPAGLIYELRVRGDRSRLESDLAVQGRVVAAALPVDAASEANAAVVLPPGVDLILQLAGAGPG
jgi:Uncharacterized protein conserved in bacteria (DUF2066)